MRSEGQEGPALDASDTPRASLVPSPLSRASRASQRPEVTCPRPVIPSLLSILLLSRLPLHSSLPAHHSLFLFLNSTVHLPAIDRCAAAPTKSEKAATSSAPLPTVATVREPDQTDPFRCAVFKDSAVRFRDEDTCRSWTDAFLDATEGFSLYDIEQAWGALQVAIAEEEVVRAEYRVTPGTWRGMLQVLRDSVRDTAECDGQCATHVCPGEGHERLVSAIHDPSHMFASRTVPCADWWSCCLGRACAVDRYFEQERSEGRLERSIQSIRERDAAREATGPSITVEQVGWQGGVNC